MQTNVLVEPTNNWTEISHFLKEKSFAPKTIENFQSEKILSWKIFQELKVEDLKALQCSWQEIIDIIEKQKLNAIKNLKEEILLLHRKFHEECVEVLKSSTEPFDASN